jgi:hypothetical protein
MSKPSFWVPREEEKEETNRWCVNSLLLNRKILSNVVKLSSSKSISAATGKNLASVGSPSPPSSSTADASPPTAAGAAFCGKNDGSSAAGPGVPANVRKG